MKRSTCLRLAMIGALAAATLLSACGRKGALDPPPGGYALDRSTLRTPVSTRGAQRPTESAAPPPATQPSPAQPSLFSQSSPVQSSPVQSSSAQPRPASESGYDEQGRPVAPQGQRKHSPFDWLLD